MRKFLQSYSFFVYLANFSRDSLLHSSFWKAYQVKLHIKARRRVSKCQRRRARSMFFVRKQKTFHAETRRPLSENFTMVFREIAHLCTAFGRSSVANATYVKQHLLYSHRKRRKIHSWKPSPRSSKAAFGVVKGRLSPCKTRSFAMQKTANGIARSRRTP